VTRLVAGLLGGVVGFTIVGLIVLVVTDHPAGELLGFVAPVIAVLLLIAQGGKVNELQTAQAVHGSQLATISHNTNGVLTARIQTAVEAALASVTSTTTSTDPTVADTTTTTAHVADPTPVSDELPTTPGG
jgi:hypothetical protein